MSSIACECEACGVQLSFLTLRDHACTAADVAAATARRTALAHDVSAVFAHDPPITPPAGEALRLLNQPEDKKVAYVSDSAGGMSDDAVTSTLAAAAFAHPPWMNASHPPAAFLSPPTTVYRSTPRQQRAW